MKDKIKRILLYLAKVAVLCLILFFTVVEPTFLIVILWISPVLYFVLYAVIAVLLAEFPRPKKPAKNFFMRHVHPLILLLAGFGACICLWFLGGHLKEKLLVMRINQFAKHAEEIIPYDTNEYNMNGLGGTDFLHNVVMIDYDTKKVAFLYGDFDDYCELKLESGAADTSLPQFTAELNAPGAWLKTYYYKDESYSHITSSVTLEMANGTVWSVSGLENTENKFLSLGIETIMLEERDKIYLVQDVHKEEIFGENGN